MTKGGVLLGKLFESMPDAVFVIDGDGTILSANEAACRQVGQALDDMVDESLPDLLGIEACEGCRDALAELFATGELQDYEFGWTRDGDRRWVSCSGRSNGILAAIIFQDVSEYKRIAEDLSRSLEFSRLVAEASNDGIWNWNLKTGEVWFSPRWKSMLGYADDELPNSIESWERVIFNEDRREALKLVEDFKAGRVAEYRAVQRFRHKAHSVRHILSRAIGERDENGELIRLVGVHTDITELRLAQDTLERNQHLMELVAWAQESFISEVEAGHIFDTLLDRLLELTESEYGFISEALTDSEGKPYLRTMAVTNIAWDEESRRFYDEQVSQGMVFDNPDTLFGRVMTDGVTVISNDPAHDPRAGGIPSGHPALKAFLGLPFMVGGRMVGMVGIANRKGGYDQAFADWLAPLLNTCGAMIEARRIRSARDESEARYKAIFENVADGIVTIEDDGTIISVNPVVKSLFGYSDWELIGRKVSILMPEPHRSRHETYMENYLRTGEAKVIGRVREITGRRKDGSEFPMEISVGELRRGKRRLFTGVMRDATERKKIERMKDEFVSTVSHELRTPLTSIHGSIRLLASGRMMPLTPEGERLLDIAHRNTGRLVNLINDILDVEKLESGRMAFDFRDMALVDAVRQAVDANQGFASERGIRIETGATVDTVVRADSGRIVQVLTNLLSNAVKFSPEGGRVEVAMALCDGWVRVTVSDTGPGVPEDFRSRIFGRFAQADSSPTRKVGGTGLGLSICKAIVERHEGRIGYDSEIGKGSDFWFELPVAGG